MNIIKVKLTNARDISILVASANKFEDEINAIHGKYVVNAKSIMGLLSLDLSNEIIISCNNDLVIKELANLLEDYIIS